MRYLTTVSAVNFAATAAASRPPAIVRLLSTAHSIRRGATRQKMVSLTAHANCVEHRPCLPNPCSCVVPGLFYSMFHSSRLCLLRSYIDTDATKLISILYTHLCRAGSPSDEEPRKRSGPNVGGALKRPVKIYVEKIKRRAAISYFIIVLPLTPRTPMVPAPGAINGFRDADTRK